MGFSHGSDRLTRADGVDMSYPNVPEQRVHTDWPCPKCGHSDHVTYRLQESPCGQYDVVRYECDDCEHIWWEDGNVSLDDEP